MTVAVTPEAVDLIGGPYDGLRLLTNSATWETYSFPSLNGIVVYRRRDDTSFEFAETRSWPVLED